jgi:hypothetical protein
MKHAARAHQLLLECAGEPICSVRFEDGGYQSNHPCPKERCGTLLTWLEAQPYLNYECWFDDYSNHTTQPFVAWSEHYVISTEYYDGYYLSRLEREPTPLLVEQL